MKPRLLIIGAGYEQIRVYQIAREMGLLITGTDMNPSAPAFDYADDKLIASTRDVEETVRVVSDYADTHPINGVITVANDVPLTVATVAKTLGLPGISVDSALAAANKLLMKERFVSDGVATPGYEVVRSLADLIEAVSTRRFPLILKPSDGRGARGVLYVEEGTDLEWAWNVSVEQSDNKILLLEDFAEGPQLSVEGVFVGDKYVALAFADRNYSNINVTKPYIVEDGGIIPSSFEGETLERIAALIELAARSLGISWGTVKADIVISHGVPLIIELAARLSGNYLATHHIPMAYGVEIVPALIRLALGWEIDPESLVPKRRKYLGVRYFFPKPGIITEIAGIDDVRSLPYLKMLYVYRKPGDYQQPITVHAARAGTIICEADTYEMARERVEDAVNTIRFVVE